MIAGTASAVLNPVLVAGLVLRREVALWAYLVAFGAAILGAVVYFGRGRAVFAAILPEGHKYEQLLIICGVVLAVGFAGVLAGLKRG
jgi:hypothetical protein